MKPFQQEFFDINRFPKQEGILVFGISMNKIGNIQSAEQCFQYVENFIPKIIKPAVGLNFVYADSLYLHSQEEAQKLKKKNEPLMHAHKYAFLNILDKHLAYIQPSFSFTSWSQMILESKDFFNLFGNLKKIYREDAVFQQLVRYDAQGRTELSEIEENFILEEILMFYLTSKGKMRLRNDFVVDKQKWVLWCYPGEPLLSEIYLYKKNFFGIHNNHNVYENSFYDLTNKKLIDFSKIGLSELEAIAQ